MNEDRLDDLVSSALAEHVGSDVLHAGLEDRERINARAGRIRRRRTGARAGIAIVALLVVVLGFRLAPDARDVVTSTVGPAGTVPGSVPVGPSTVASQQVGGADAWLVPPASFAGHELDWVAPMGTAAGGDVQVGTSVLGRATITTRSVTPFLTVRLAYGSGGDGGIDPPLRLTFLTSTTVDEPVRAANGSPAAYGTTASGWRFVDLGDLCATDGQAQLVTPILVTFTPCRHVAVVWKADVLVAIDAVPGTPFSDLIYQLHLGSLDEFTNALAGVNGAASVRDLAIETLGTTVANRPLGVEAVVTDDGSEGYFQSKDLVGKKPGEGVAVTSATGEIVGFVISPGGLFVSKADFEAPGFDWVTAYEQRSPKALEQMRKLGLVPAGR